MVSLFNHPFHIVGFSLYPLFASSLALGLTTSLVIFFKFGLLKGLFFCLGSLLFVSFIWSKDIVLEGLTGFHNFFVIDGFKIGVVLFIFSEFIFFFSIF